MISRRKLLSSSALGAAALGLAACSTQQIASFETAWTGFATQVQSLVNTAAKYIPTIESVAATMASLFGPAWQTAVALTSAVVNQVVGVLVTVVGNLTPPAQARMRARLMGSSQGAPVYIGTTAGGVSVTGYR